MKKTLTIISGFALLGSFIWIAWIFIQSLTAAAPGVAAAVIGFIGAVIAAAWTHTATKRREINSRHFVEKKNAYMQIVNLMFDFLRKAKDSNDQADQSEQTKPADIIDKDILDKIFNFKKELLFWGSVNVITAMNDFESTSRSQNQEVRSEEGSLELLLSVDNLLRAIRKDLGHEDSQLKKGRLVGMLLIAEDRKKVIT